MKIIGAHWCPKQDLKKASLDGVVYCEKEFNLKQGSNDEYWVKEQAKSEF